MLTPEDIAAVQRKAEELATELGLTPKQDIIWHVMETRGLTFVQAVRFLAVMAGVELD